MTSKRFANESAPVKWDKKKKSRKEIKMHERGPIAITIIAAADEKST